VSPAGAWIMQMVAFRASGSPVNTGPPTVSITAPSPGATVSATVTLTATATGGESSVAGVQFQIDGINVGSPDTAAPYSRTFDTAQLPNGTHTIGAYAWDLNRNVGNAAITVTFSNTNPGNPAQTGLWSGTIAWPMVTVHANVLPDGQILFFDGQNFGSDAKLWDPLTGAFTDVPVSDNVFCSGHAPLADGTILVAGGHAGGHIGIDATNIFDPRNRSWSMAGHMSNPRWYPTVTTLSDGRLFVMSGETQCDGCVVDVPEVYDPASNAWTSLSGARLSVPYYPFMFLLPDGRILVAGIAEGPIATRVLNLSTQTWTMVDPAVLHGGTAAMYLPGKIMKSGRSIDPDQATEPSVRSTYVLDMTQPSPLWRQTASMAFPRNYHNETLLPDGTVLVTGGGRTTGAIDLANAVYEAELWNPVTEAFTTLAPMHAPRLYHSIALLLPDGRVLTSGGGRFNGVNEPTDQASAEFFSPPYLFKGSRPTITSAPTQLQRGQTFEIESPDASRIATVSLVRLASVTHAFNMNQRFIPLSFSAGAGVLAVTAPATANIAPPGYYMLFIVDTNGVPSMASFVRF